MARVQGLVQYYGGKGMMLAKLLPLIPWSRVYVEPFGGSASVLLNLQPRPVEVYNDLDGNVVNLARVMQNPRTHRRLRYMLEHTLYARAEFERALEILQTGTSDPIERAWAFFVAKNQGFNGMAEGPGDWSRVFVQGSGMARVCGAFTRRVRALRAQHERLKRVQVDNIDALECIRYWDTPETLFYCDPPYLADTRAIGKRAQYTYEMADEQHEELIELLTAVQGGVVLSGYDCELYRRLDSAGWERHEFTTACHAAGSIRGTNLRGEGAGMKHVSRVEVVWRNPRAVEMARGRGLFDQKLETV